MKKTRSWTSCVVCATSIIVFVGVTPNPAVAQTVKQIAPRSGMFYETNYGSNTVEVFSTRGADLGVFGTLTHPTGLAFDKSGNLYVSSDDPAAYSIQKFRPDGSVSIFASTGLNGPHALAFDQAGNLYVANIGNNTIEKFTPDGVGMVFADAADGLEHPVDLVFDTAGNLYVSNAFGGPTHTGSIVKITPGGVGSVFADSGFHLAYGLALDRAGNLYVANNGNQTIEKFSSTGADLGVFARTQLGPHFLAMSRPSRQTEDK